MTPALAGWEVIRARHLYHIIDQRAQGDRPPLLAVSIHVGVVPRESLTEDEPRADDLSNYKLCTEGDIVLNRMRAFQGGIGISPQRGLVSPDYLVLRPEPGVEGRFLHHLFRSNWFVGEMISRLRGIGSTDQGNVRTPRINAEDLGDIPIALPPRSKQRAIADFLDTETARIDALITKKGCMLQLLEGRATSSIAHFFGAEIGFSADGIPVSVGRHRMVRLGAVAAVQSGLTLDEGRSLDESAVSHPYLRVANVQDGRIDLSEVKEVRVPPKLALRCQLKPGDVLMTEGGDPDKLGRGTVWQGEVLRCLHQNHIFAVRPENVLLPDFLALLTRTPYARTYFEVTASKTTGIASTSTAKIASFRVPLLSLDEQQQIVGKTKQELRTITALAERIRRQIELLREHRQALITAAVKGQLDIPDQVAG